MPARKYTRSRVRKALPEDFAYIIEELMYADTRNFDKEAYYAAIVDAVVRTGRGPAFVEALCGLIQRLAIERLHIIGDIYDRGPHPDAIMEALIDHHSVDIQWGNHDIVWMALRSANAAVLLMSCETARVTEPFDSRRCLRNQYFAFGSIRA